MKTALSRNPEMRVNVSYSAPKFLLGVAIAPKTGQGALTSPPFAHEILRKASKKQGADA